MYHTTLSRVNTLHKGKVLQDYAGYCFMKVQIEKDMRELLETPVRGTESISFQTRVKGKGN